MYEQPAPGEWPNSMGHDYRYLVALARRRLVGHEHFAEDVVTRALLRWRQIPATSQRARIETVITSEAYSLLRSERRRASREAVVTTDPTSSMSRAAHHDNDLLLLRQLIAAVCQNGGSPVTGSPVDRFDLEVLELLFAGMSLAETARTMEVARHEVKSSRQRWRRILRRALEPEQPAPPTQTHPRPGRLGGA